MQLRPLWQRAGAEVLGTALLVFIGPGAIMLAERSGAFGHLGVSLSFGAVVAVAVALFGPVSGAHINPAVTLALGLRGRVPSREVVPYLTAQLVGAALAVSALSVAIGSVAQFGATVPRVPLVAAFAIEAAYTAVLGASVGLLHRGAVPTRWAALLLGTVVAVGAFVTGPYTGGSFNPARSFGPALASGVWTAHWLYWLAPTLGFLVGYVVVTPAPRPAPSSR